MNDISPGDHVVLVDGSYLLYQAYFANKGLTRSDGHPTGAAFGFLQSLWFMLTTRDGLSQHPTHIVVFFDGPEETHRHRLSPDYKANRKARDSDLEVQRGLVEDCVRSFGIPVLKMAGWEADDLIATFARIASGHGAVVTIISKDKDLMQLVGPNTFLQWRDKGANVTCGVEHVRRKWNGCGPSQVGDVLALMGDNSDNIKGAPGVGEVGATKMVAAYGDLDGVLLAARRGRLSGKAGIVLTLPEVIAEVLLASHLVSLEAHVPVPNIDVQYRGFEPGRVEAFCERIDARDFIDRIRGHQGGGVEPAFI